MPFDPHDRADLENHFNDHGSDFDLDTPEEYEKLADAFMDQEPVLPPVHQCIRRDGSICRFNTKTLEFGIRNPWGTIATYFKPIPAKHIPLEQRTEPGHHPFCSNWEYFQFNCKR